MSVVISDVVAAALLNEAVEELARTSKTHYHDVPQRVPLLAFAREMRANHLDLVEIVEDVDEVLEYAQEVGQ